MIVADASLIANLLLPQSGSSVAEAVLARDSTWWAPLFWRFELHSALLKHARARQLTVSECGQVMAQAFEVLDGNEQDANYALVMETALDFKISSYDAEYLALARHLRVPLVTFDRKLILAARGIAVYPVEFTG